MKKIITTLLLSTVFMAFSVHAKEDMIYLKDNSSILGKWQLKAEAPALHKEKKKVNINWEFKNDGSLRTWAKDTRGRTGNMQINVKYTIENGMIRKQSQPGREKYEFCKVIKQEGKKMVMKCKYLYFFMEKK